MFLKLRQLFVGYSKLVRLGAKGKYKSPSILSYVYLILAPSLSRPNIFGHPWVFYRENMLRS